MKYKHTKGNWAVLEEELDKNYIRIRGASFGCRYKIANVIIPDYGRMFEMDETKANAKLIASAPEMLFALTEIIQGYEDGKNLHELIEKAKLVIEKAATIEIE